MDEFHRITELIQDAREAYYNTDSPIMPDDEFDALVDRARELGADVDSAVGAPVDNPAKAHPVPMLSLSKVTTEEEVAKFFQDIGNVDVVVQVKADGVSLSLEYDEGNLSRAVTRGDGVRGEDVTHIVRHLDTVPTELPDAFSGVIRGEVVIHREDLDKRFKNTRNAVSGLLNYRTKSPEDAAKYGCRFYAFDLYNDEGLNAVEAIEYLRALGFEPVLSAGAGNVSSAMFALNEFFSFRGTDAIPYDIDGVVIKVSDANIRATLGNRSNSPRWAVAYKQAGEKVVTQLLDVVWQVGKSGTIAPVAILDPVDLQGTTITRATLHNISEIRKMGLKIGHMVYVERAGMVIPRVSGVVA